MAAAVIFIGVGIERPVWLDEANSVLIAARGPVGILDSLSRDNNLPFFYFLLSAWMHLFGDSEIALRSLSAVFYLGGCGVAFTLGRLVTGSRRAACYSGFFYLSSALAIRQTHSIRMYSLLGLLSGLSTLAFLRLFWQRDRTWKVWALLVSVNAVGLLTHVWFVFVLFAQFAALAAVAPRELWRWGLPAGISTLPFLALWGRAFVGQLHNGATEWMPQIWPFFLFYASLEFYYPLATLGLYVLALAGPAIGSTSVREWIRRNRGTVLLAAIFAVSLAAPLSVSLVRPIYWPGRYMIIALAPLAAFLGCMLSSHLPRPFLAGLGFLLLMVQVSSHIQGRDAAPESLLSSEQTDRATAQFLLTHAAPRDAVVFTSLTRAAADYYFRRADAAGRFWETSFPSEVAGHLGWIDLTISPARRVALEKEADATVRDLQSVAARGGAVWLYDGYAANISGILKDRLDVTLQLRSEHPLQGPYHKRILEYGAKASAPQQPRLSNDLASYLHNSKIQP